MVDIVSSAASALQATLTGELLKALSSALATGNITDAPAAIRNSTTPIAISGTVAEQVADGGVVVQTAAGPITLSLDKAPPLPQGTLTLLIQPGNPPTASIVAQQVVTPQAQIQTQATAAQQTQNIQTAPQSALPPLVVGQVLTATPLPANAVPVAVGPNAPLQTHVAVPVVAAAASSAAVASAQAVQLPIAVLLNAAIPPAPATPGATYVAKQPLIVAPVEAAPEEEPVSPQAGQRQSSPAQTSASFLPRQQAQPQQVTVAPLQAAPVSDEDHQPVELTPQANALAAQESVNQNAPARPVPQAVAYNPATPLQTQAPAAQSFVVVSIETPEKQDAPLASHVAEAPAPPSPLPAPFAAPPVPVASAGQNVTATVVAQTTAGQPLLATQSGALLVDQKVAPTAIGTEIVLQPLTPQQAASQPVTAGGVPVQPRATPAPAPLNDVPITVARQQSWPALAQLLTTLQTASPQAASFIREAIPSLGGSFAQVFTAFLARGETAPLPTPSPFEALKLALPHAAPTSADAPPELRAALLQLGADLVSSTAKATMVPNQPQAWQSHAVPILTDYGLTMAQLFVRQQVDEVDDRPQTLAHSSATRFLVEISPSQLGPVQLDGLLRKDRAYSGRLDLIVRTEFAVSPEAGADMARLFQDSLGATGMTGTLGFQIGAETFVLPQSDALYRGDI